MVRLINSEYKVCAECYGPMKKMLGLDIWMCEMCLGVNYRLPEEWRQIPAEQDEDEGLYKTETSGE